MSNSLPFFGDFKIDVVVAAIFGLTGLWMMLKYGNRFGLALIAVGAFWLYQLFFQL